MSSFSLRTLATPGIYACRTHPQVRVTLELHAQVSCARCGKPLRPVAAASPVQKSLFDLEEEHHAF